jgi:predicted amidohydrolase YtcJ
MDLIKKVIPPNSPERDRQALSLAFDACLRNGITSFHDAGATRNQLELYHTSKEEGNLRVRLYVMITGWDRDLVYDWMAQGPEIDSTGWLTVRAVKLYSDGALGSRGAWMLEPYTDRPGFYGMPTLSMDTVYKTAVEGLKHGFQICTHAIGDRANREVLDRYAMAFEAYPDIAKNHRFRIEHAQHLDPGDIPRFAELGVIPAMQAIHMSSDRPWAIDRLGAKRIREGTYVWQSILATGAKIINGTDAPVEPVSPVASFYAAITRKTLQGEPEGGYEPEQKMTRDQALWSYTIDAAYGAFEEGIKGSLEPGKRADFTIFSADLMTIPEEDVLKTSVAMVFVDGKLVYQVP